MGKGEKKLFHTGCEIPAIRKHGFIHGMVDVPEMCIQGIINSHFILVSLMPFHVRNSHSLSPYHGFYRCINCIINTVRYRAQDSTSCSPCLPAFHAVNFASQDICLHL